MITQLLNNIKKNLINLFSLYCMWKNYMREKKKNWKHWVLLGARPNANGSCSQQDPKLMGPTVAGSKVILAPSGAGLNSNGSCWVGPNLIYSHSMWLRSQTQDQLVLTQGPKELGPDEGPIKLWSWRRPKQSGPKAEPKTIGSWRRTPNNRVLTPDPRECVLRQDPF
jgi:hypothetical protein